MSKQWLDEANKWMQREIPNTDEGHREIMDSMALLTPNARQNLIDDHAKTLPDDPNPRQFADHFALSRKMKAAHAAYKKVGR